MKKMILMGLLMAAVTTSCKKDDEENDAGFDGSISDIENFYNSDVLDELISLGLDINTGSNPPNIEGVFNATPFILQASSVNGDTTGSQFPDLSMIFSNQDNTSLTIDFNGVNGAETYDGDGSFISGEGNDFSVFLKVNVTLNGNVAETTFAISGSIEDGGLGDIQVGLIMIDDGGDPDGAFIENNTGRLLYDSDGFSEEL